MIKTKEILALYLKKKLRKNTVPDFLFLFLSQDWQTTKNTSANWTIESGVKILPENYESRSQLITRGLTQTAILRMQGDSGILYERVDFIT